MNKVLIFFLVLIYSTDVLSQTSIDFGMSFNTFSMNDLKGYQNVAVENFLVDGRNVHSFPSYWGYNMNVRILESKNEHIQFHLGGTIEYTSTGSNTNYSDFSGSLSYKQLVNRAGLGMNFSVTQKRQPEKFSLGGEIIVLASLSNIEFESILTIGNSSTNENLSFNSVNYHAIGSFLMIYDFSDKLFLVGKIGYDMGIIFGKINLKDNSDAFLLKVENEDPAEIDWSGLRIGLGIGINFN